MTVEQEQYILLDIANLIRNIYKKPILKEFERYLIWETSFGKFKITVTKMEDDV